MGKRKEQRIGGQNPKTENPPKRPGGKDDTEFTSEIGGKKHGTRKYSREP